VWCGVVWCGVVWYDVVRYAVVLMVGYGDECSPASTQASDVALA
jgi:hypothetical protein